MLFNPIINIGLAGLSLLFGLWALNSTESVLVMLPFLFFLGLFAFSLLRPVQNRSVVPGPYRTEPVRRRQSEKLTMDRLWSLAHH